MVNWIADEPSPSPETSINEEKSCLTFPRDDSTSSNLLFNSRTVAFRFVGVFGGATGLLRAGGLCRGSPSTLTGEDARELSALAAALSLGSIGVSFPLAAVLAFGCGADEVGVQARAKDFRRVRGGAGWGVEVGVVRGGGAGVGGAVLGRELAGLCVCGMGEGLRGPLGALR